MNRIKLSLIGIVFLSTLIIFSCGQKKSKKSEALSTEQLNDQISEKPRTENIRKKIHPGKAVYDKYCLACHMADGMGVPGLNPPLSSNPVISGENGKLIGIVLDGMKGKIKVNGKAYNSYMPPHNFLSDQQIADVLTYVRSTFGSDSDSISHEEVMKIRRSQ